MRKQQWTTLGNDGSSLDPTGLQEGRINLSSVFCIERVLLVIFAPEENQRGKVTLKAEINAIQNTLAV